LYHQAKVKPVDQLIGRETDKNLTRGSFNGYMSPATKRKFRRICSTWLRSIMLYRAEIKQRWDPGRAYPTMITLTLPTAQQHSDAEINRACLQPWLQMMRRDHGVEHYAWRAEAQENGNLHYHIILDRYIPKHLITLSWNQCIDVLGYRWRYFEATGSLTPPSTEVHRITEQVKDKKTGELRTVDPVDYLIDYLLDLPVPEELGPTDPNEEPKPKKMIGYYRDKHGVRKMYITRAITGRVWGISDGLREIKEPKARATTDMIMALESATETGQLRRVDLEHATMYFGKVSVTLGRSHPGAWAVIKQYYIHVFAHLYRDQLPAQYIARHPPMDPRGLWIDLSNFAFHYPASHEEQIDAYNEAHPNDERLASQWQGIKGYLTAAPEWEWKRARTARKMHRLGITDLHQRWSIAATSPLQ
jgi:hypothetical protein